MTIRSGLAAQFAAAAETTYGTRVVPDHFYEFVNEAVALQQDYIDAKGIRANDLVQRSTRQVKNKKGAQGPVELEVGSKNFALLFKHMLGANAITTPMGATTTRLHTLTMADPYGLSLSVQVGRPTTGGTGPVRPFDYTGAKIVGWELGQALDDLLRLKLTLDAYDEDTGQTLATATYPAAYELFDYSECAINVGGSAFTAKGFSVKCARNDNVDRRFIRSDTRKKEPIPAAEQKIDFQLDGEFEDLTAYNRFVNNTIAQIDATWTGSVIEGAFNNKIILTLAACRFEGDTPGVKDQGIVPISLKGSVLYDGSASPVKLEVYTTETTV